MKNSIIKYYLVSPLATIDVNEQNFSSFAKLHSSQAKVWASLVHPKTNEKAIAKLPMSLVASESPSKQNLISSEGNLCKLLMEFLFPIALKAAGWFIAARIEKCHQKTFERKNLLSLSKVVFIGEEIYGCRRNLLSNDTHLIAEDSDAACRRDLVRAEPNSCHFRWEGEDEHLWHSHNALANEGDVKQIGMNSQNLHPRAEASAQTSEHRCYS